VAEIDENMQKYDIPNALKPILPLIDDASNWYVRRSRKRYWKSDNDEDKTDAYTTLHYVLVQFSLMLAPFVPFLSDELYKNLTDGESVHLENWPEVGHINELAISRMAEIRELITSGLSQRASAGIKVRQPLKQATISLEDDIPQQEWKEYSQILQEELNVKNVSLKKGEKSISIDTDLSDDLVAEGLARDIVRLIQSVRKKAGLNVDDRIHLDLRSENSMVINAIDMFGDYIANETLAVFKTVKLPKYSEKANVGEYEINISVDLLSK
jgi:isoleucyl-tRNA synthetase